MPRLAIALALVVAALAACGESTIRPEGAEKSVVDVVSERTSFRPTDVSCPSDVEAKVGQRFDCTFSGPEGAYTAYMTVSKVDGEDVLFKIVTRPTPRSSEAD